LMVSAEVCTVRRLAEDVNARPLGSRPRTARFPASARSTDSISFQAESIE
jgi:hypothetical protein